MYRFRPTLGSSGIDEWGWRPAGCDPQGAASVSHPLAGKHIVITRPEAQAQEFVDLLRQVGAIPIIFPTIQIAPLADNTQLDAALGRLKEYDWVVFTSANGVRVVCDRMQ